MIVIIVHCYFEFCIVVLSFSFCLLFNFCQIWNTHQLWLLRICLFLKDFPVDWQLIMNFQCFLQKLIALWKLSFHNSYFLHKLPSGVFSPISTILKLRIHLFHADQQELWNFKCQIQIIHHRKQASVGHFVFFFFPSFPWLHWLIFMHFFLFYEHGLGFHLKTLFARICHWILLCICCFMLECKFIYK